ncbi:MAG TPA: OmpA family protein [Gemmatimonadales bacterium]|nr:OmpA family protein [Gemmatimonadales bacterium]
MRRFMLGGLLLLAGTAPLAAQHGNSYEFGVFGGYTRYDPTFGLANRMGGGARLGYMFGNLLGVEVDVLFPSEYTVGATSTQIDPLIGSASLVLNVLHAERNILYILGGYSLLDFSTTAPYDFTDNGVHAAIGDRIFLSHNLALRLEARGIYTPSTKSTFSTSSVTHLAATVGFTILAPSKKKTRPAPEPAAAAAPAADPDPAPAPATVLAAAPLLAQDADGDRVPDREDVCPNTPSGVTVDARGCPLDGDHDGVPDGLDKCPNTPVGAAVDAMGCSADADKDGVPDGVDKCANTPFGAMVDATGCPVDSDKDAVPDGLDRCPGTPAGAVVDATGCVADADRDGVGDGVDKCPNTPRGALVDATGCPVAADADADGVPNDVDKCPNTPKGVPVDATGCMILFQPQPTAAPAAVGAAAGAATLRAVAARPTLILRGVNFETGRSALTPDSYAALDQVAGSLVANPGIRIEIAGYTDNVGTVASNITLSQGRAAAVRAYLARKGVGPNRMLARGYGARGAIASNATASGRAQNRRVELHKLP